MVKKEISKGFGIAALWTGIVGILICIMPYFGIFFSIMGIVFGSIQNKKNRTGCGTAGIVLGILGTILNAVILFFVFVLLIVAPEMFI